MDPIASHAEAVLRHHPAPALRLSELTELLRSDLPRTTLDATALRHRLERYPETFRFLDPWRGPWCHTRGRFPAELGASEPWVVVVADPGVDGQRGATTLSRMRESVRWIVRAADPRSPREVSRVYGIVLEEQEARGALNRAA